MIAVDWDRAAGSSPHTRGARPVQSQPRGRARIIPAYAGSTPIGVDPRRRSPDHPRIRGEHSTYKIGTLKATGSSPHTRGAPFLPAVRPSDVGIIPAYAGSTRRNAISSYSRRDHPRIRGEHEKVFVTDPVDGGSSPHTRGAHQNRRGLARQRGIIPAYAGSTTVAQSASGHGSDHPRIRGEHL